MKSTFSGHLYSFNYSYFSANINVFSFYEKLYGHLLSTDKLLPILDSGGGSGRLSMWLLTKGYQNVYLCDVHSILNCNEYDPRLHIFETSEISDYRDIFSLVLLNDVLEHIGNESVVDVLSKIKSSLINNLCISGKIPNVFSSVFGTDFYADSTHCLA